MGHHRFVKPSERVIFVGFSSDLMGLMGVWEMSKAITAEGRRLARAPDFTQSAKAAGKGFEKVVVTQLERSFWRQCGGQQGFSASCHQDPPWSSDPSNGQGEKAAPGVTDGLGVGKDRSGQNYSSSWK